VSEREELLEELRFLRGYVAELEESGMELLPLDPAESAAAAPEPATEPVVQSMAAESAPVYAASAEPAVAQQESLEEVRLALGECRRCRLGNGRTSLVFGSGNPHARLFFVGEAPAEEDDRQGEPFVGEAGELLTKIIRAMGFQRDQVYVCNVLKCRVPEDRPPQPEEVGECLPYLLRQVRAVAPDAIVALGTFAAQTLLGSKEPISKLRGEFHDFHGIPLMPTFHPGFLLRNPAMKREVWEDMKRVMQRLGVEPPHKGGAGQ
jgi:DNA polymerase